MQLRKLAVSAVIASFGLMALVAGSNSSVMAGTVDPQIYVCTGCTAPPSPGDPNLINANSINVGFAGNHAAVSPLLIIVGVPSSGVAPTISLPKGVSAAVGGTYYGLTNATTGTTAGELEGMLQKTGCADAYTCSGLNSGSGGGASESFVNWTGNPFPNGVSNPDAGVTSFNLYAYAIDFALNSGTGGNSPINIDLTGSTAGDFVIAYDCAVSGTTCTDGSIGSTPFTDAGFVAPESGSVALLGIVLLGFAGIGVFGRRKLAA